MTKKWFSGRKVRGLSTDSKPTNPETDAEFYETDTKKTFDYTGGSWVERSSGGGVVVGDTISFPHTMTDSDYVKTGTITLSNFTSNGVEGSPINIGTTPAYSYINYGSSGTTTMVFYINFGNQYIKTLHLYVTTYNNAVATTKTGVMEYTDGTEEVMSPTAGTMTMNRQLNRFRYTVTGNNSRASSNDRKQNNSSSTTYTLDNVLNDIYNEADVGTPNEMNPWVENSFGQRLLSAIDVNPTSRNTGLKYNVEAWVNGAWVLVRKTSGLGKIRLNLINTSKIKVTCTDTVNRVLALDKFRVYSKTTDDIYSHGHVDMDSSYDSLGLDGT